MVLTRKDLENVICAFPAISERFNQVVVARLAEVNQHRSNAKRVKINAVPSILKASSNNIMHMVNEEEESI